MKNQYSFRLTTTLNPNDATAKTTQVINKVDSNGDKFYPTFTEETVVITNDDRTIIETTRATCNNWVLTFTKRWLPDDGSLTPVANRALTWNPGSLCFVTAWASDRIDKDDDIVWAGKQTYEWDMESRGKATYKGRLITEKWVEYPHFDSLEDLQDYASPFGWMFAVVDSDWELYRYNAVDEEWSVVTTSTPVQPAQASDVAIGTVRVATDAEFTAGTDQGSNNEYLLATITQIKNNTPTPTLHKVAIEQYSDTITPWNPKSISYVVPKAWFVVYDYDMLYDSWTGRNWNLINQSGTANPVVMNWVSVSWKDAWVRNTVAVWPGTLTLTWKFRDWVSSWSFQIYLDTYFYFE